MVGGFFSKPSQIGSFRVSDRLHEVAEPWPTREPVQVTHKQIASTRFLIFLPYPKGSIIALVILVDSPEKDLFVTSLLLTISAQTEKGFSVSTVVSLDTGIGSRSLGWREIVWPTMALLPSQVTGVILLNDKA